TVEGMTCASCIGRVERILRAVPGVQAAAANLATGRATVTGLADPEALVAAVTAAGYPARLHVGSEPAQDRHAAEEA
ncbi:MAG TPA: heavy metal-associated domain-containing protein, partial [Paracoccaceae bacterium]|nr:heavy metal-associated domain-containing protein [Paracoccaceae bacterium]